MNNLCLSECHIFPQESNDVMQQLVKGRMLQAQVVGHEVDGVPYIKLCEVLADQVYMQYLFVKMHPLSSIAKGHF